MVLAEKCALIVYYITLRSITQCAKWLLAVCICYWNTNIDSLTCTSYKKYFNIVITELIFMPYTVGPYFMYELVAGFKHKILFCKVAVTIAVK